MAIALRGAAWVPGGNPTTSFTATINSSVVAGDVLYMVCTSRDHIVSTDLATLTDNDSGGNLWGLIANSTDRKAYLFTKIATSGTASKTVTFAGAIGSCSGVGKAFFGHSTEDTPQVNIAVESNSAGDETDAGFTPDAADSMLCTSIHNYDNDNAVTSLSSATYGAMTVTEKLSTGGSDCATAFGHDLMSGASATGNITWSQTDGKTYSIHWELKEEVVQAFKVETLRRRPTEVIEPESIRSVPSIAFLFTPPAAPPAFPFAVLRRPVVFDPVFDDPARRQPFLQPTAPVAPPVFPFVVLRRPAPDVLPEELRRDQLSIAFLFPPPVAAPPFRIETLRQQRALELTPDPVPLRYPFEFLFPDPIIPPSTTVAGSLLPRRVLGRRGDMPPEGWRHDMNSSTK